MKMKRYEYETDGFHGVYYPRPEGSKKAMIIMFGDDSEDYLARTAARYFQSLGCNVMAMSSRKKDYGYHSYRLECVENAIDVMRACGNTCFGIAGLSTTGMIALAAASLIPDLTLTIAMTASDFVMQGFLRDGLDGCGERPAEGESTLTWRHEQLPYLPYAYAHPDYWQMLKQEAENTHNMAAARNMFDESENRCPLREEMMIKVENAKGHVLMIGAEDDALWDTCRYIRRVEERLKTREHSCVFEPLTFAHGTHFILPETMMKMLLPAGVDFLLAKCFPAAKGYTDECRKAREEVDAAIRRTVAEMV